MFKNKKKYSQTVLLSSVRSEMRIVSFSIHSSRTRKLKNFRSTLDVVTPSNLLLHLGRILFLSSRKRASLIAQLVKNLPAMQETVVRSLGWEDPLKKGNATHSSILAWRIPCSV